MQAPFTSVFLILVVPLGVIAFVYLRWWPHQNRWAARLNVLASSFAATVTGSLAWVNAAAGSAIWQPVLATTVAYLTFVVLLIGVQLLLAALTRKRSET